MHNLYKNSIAQCTSDDLYWMRSIFRQNMTPTMQQKLFVSNIWTKIQSTLWILPRFLGDLGGLVSVFISFWGLSSSFVADQFFLFLQSFRNYTDQVSRIIRTITFTFHLTFRTSAFPSNEFRFTIQSPNHAQTEYQV